MHGGSARQVREKARLRILALVDPSLATLARAVNSKRKGEPSTVEIQAARDILDRAGLQAAQLVLLNADVSVSDSRPGELVESRIIQLIERRRESGGLPHDASGNPGSAPVRLELVGAPVAIDARNEGRGDQS